MLDKPVSVVRRLQEIRSLILDATQDGKAIIDGLVELAQDPGVPPKDRLKAFDMLLDRAWGRVPQEIDLNASTTPTDRPLRSFSVEELKRMEEATRLDEVRREQEVVEGQRVLHKLESVEGEVMQEPPWGSNA